MESAISIIPQENLMPTLTPEQQVEKASEMARVLQGVVQQANLARNFGGKKDHLEYEAWQTIAQFFNCTPQTEWTKPIKDGDKIVGYEARVNVVNAEGRIIASAESMCMRDEPNWKTKPLYALRSMAQTRTAGKALRSVFAWVAVLAGYSATPAEEMSEEFVKKPKQPPVSKSSAAKGETLSLSGTIEKVEIKEGETKGRAWTRYGIHIDGNIYGTFDTAIGERAQQLEGQSVEIAYEKGDKFNTITDIWDGEDRIPY